MTATGIVPIPSSSRFSLDPLRRGRCLRGVRRAPRQFRGDDHHARLDRWRSAERRRRCRLGQVSPMTLPLSGQVITRPVWPEPTARALTVRSLHNGTEIAFLLEWQDNTKNDRLTPGTFRDGVAIGLAARRCSRVFLHGTTRPLYQYLALEGRLAERYRSPGRQDFRKKEGRGADVRSHSATRVSSVEDLIGGGFSTLTTKEKQGRVQGKAVMEGRCVACRHAPSLVSEEQENEAKLVPGRVQTVSFAVWNGENKERNGQKAVAPWFQLDIDPVAKL